MRNKKLICSLLSAALVMSMFPGIVFAVPTGVEINEANFPEKLFRDFVFGYDTDKNGYLSDAEIAKVTKIDVGGEDFIDLTGIKYFTSLTELNCHSDNMHNLDLSNNTELEYLDCSDNSIQILDLGNNTNLKYLACDANELNSLNISNCTKLEYLDCHHNSLMSLNLGNSTSLEYLDCSDNLLSSLDVTENTKLDTLACYSNSNLTTLEIGSIPSILSLYDLDAISIETALAYGEEITYEEYDNRINNNQYAIIICVSDDEIFKHFASVFAVDDSLAVTTDNTPTATPTSTPTVTVTPTSVPTEAPKSGMVSFAERLYTEALHRNYDEAGRDYWVSQLRSGVSGAEVARQFFFSEEFINANLSDEFFVDRLYGTFMNQAADEGGKTYWLSQLSSGAMTREDIFNGFINSPEWANICLEAGIVSGGTGVPTITVDPSEAVTAFATRLYTTCLGREADSEGVTWWATELANMRRTGTTAAEGFFFSDEYVSAGHSDAEFVTALYSTFMNRAYDQAGYDYWMGELSNGCTRENVLERFAGCDEFGNICADAGIIR